MSGRYLVLGSLTGGIVFFTVTYFWLSPSSPSQEKEKTVPLLSVSSLEASSLKREEKEQRKEEKKEKKQWPQKEKKEKKTRPWEKELATVQKKMQKGELAKAVEKLKKVWQKYPQGRREFLPLVWKLAKMYFFSPIPWSEEQMDHLRSGETLSKVSRRLGMSLSLLRYLNPAKVLKAGERLKVLSGAPRLLLSQGYGYVFLGKQWVLALPLRSSLPRGKYQVEKSWCQANQWLLKTRDNQVVSFTLVDPGMKELVSLFSSSFPLEVRD